MWHLGKNKSQLFILTIVYLFDIIILRASYEEHFNPQTLNDSNYLNASYIFDGSIEELRSLKFRNYTCK